MTKLEQLSAYSYLDNYSKRENAKNAYNAFVRAINNNNNESIETTKVYELLELLLSSNDCVFFDTLFENTELYRGRRMSIDDLIYNKKLQIDDDGSIHGYDRFDSKEPPLNVSTGGRNNIKGMSYLYLASDPYTACAEIKPIRGTIISLATFKIICPLKAFNFSDDVNVKEYSYFGEMNNLSVAHLLTLIMQAFYSPGSDMEGYTVSQYISDLVRKHGFDVLVYRSYISQGKNYTIFNSCEKNVSFVSSEIVYTGQQKLEIKKIMNENDAIIQPRLSSENSKKVIQRIRNYIYSSTKHFDFIK